MLSSPIVIIYLLYCSKKLHIVPLISHWVTVPSPVWSGTFPLPFGIQHVADVVGPVQNSVFLLSCQRFHSSFIAERHSQSFSTLKECSSSLHGLNFLLWMFWATGRGSLHCMWTSLNVLCVALFVVCFLEYCNVHVLLVFFSVECEYGVYRTEALELVYMRRREQNRALIVTHFCSVVEERSITFLWHL